MASIRKMKKRLKHMKDELWAEFKIANKMALPQYTRPT